MIDDINIPGAAVGATPPVEEPLLETAAPEEEIKDPNVPISDDLKGCLLDLLRTAENEDQSAYWALIQKWTRLEYYFNNIIGIFWDASYAGGSGGWTIPDWDQLEQEGDIPPRIIAIYRAHAESIIAALSVNTPSVVFFPDDAEDPLDIETADTCQSIAELIQKHLKSPLLFMRALTILFNQGTVCAYNYYKTSPQFGKKHTPMFEDINFIEHYTNTCPICGFIGPETIEPLIEPIQCPQCGNVVPPESIPVEGNMTVQTGVKSFDKGRVMIDLFDPRSVKFSIYAKEQSHIGYLLLVFNQNVAMVRAEFEDNTISAYYSGDDLQWARNSTNYLGQFPDNVSNVKCLWLRPWQFHSLGSGKEAEIAELKQLYPSGCYAIFVDDKIRYITEENMDDHWTISQNPLGAYIHGEPLGTNLAVVQDLQAEVDELRLQTLEHGIPEKFVKPETLDLDKYKQSMARPGATTPVKASDPGRPLGESFFETRTSTMSSEIEVFSQDLKNKAEFTTGSFPSIYGGAGEGGGTAYEYKKSNASALQRLGITWKIVSEFWSELITKCTSEFISQMEGDERYTDKQDGQFKNITIQQNKLRGNISRVEPEYSDQLPITWEQINSVVTNLMTLQSPEINEVLFNPNNAELMKKAVGLHKLWIPGEDSRTKQYAEYIQLSQSAPMPAPIQPGAMPGEQPMLLPSVMPEAIDNHFVEMEVLQAILTSPRGQKLKAENPEAYQNCILHWQFHQMMLPPPVEEESKPKQGEKANVTE